MSDQPSQSPHKLWQEANGNHEKYIELMKQHGHIVDNVKPEVVLAKGSQNSHVIKTRDATDGNETPRNPVAVDDVYRWFQHDLDFRITLIVERMGWRPFAGATREQAILACFEIISGFARGGMLQYGGPDALRDLGSAPSLK